MSLTFVRLFTGALCHCHRIFSSSVVTPKWRPRPLLAQQLLVLGCPLPVQLHKQTLGMLYILSWLALGYMIIITIH